MYQYIFRRRAEKELKKLPGNDIIRIKDKLRYFLTAPNPLNFASYLKKSSLGSYRFRIGDYRVIFDIEGEKLIILTVGHRREVYK